MMSLNNYLELHYMIQLGLLFVLVVTGAWKKSFTTLFFIISTIIMFFNCTTCPDMYSAYYAVNGLSVLAVLRAMFHTGVDKIVRKH